MGFTFKQRSVAEKLRDFANSNLGDKEKLDRGGPPDFRKVLLVKTPAAGCKAREITSPDYSSRNEYKMYFAECEVLSTYSSDATVMRLDDSEIRTCNALQASDLMGATTGSVEVWQDLASLTAQVYNPHNIHIEGNALYIAVWIDGNYVFVCHGTAFRLLKTPSGGIPGRSGTTLGKAVCELYHLELSGSDAVLTQDLDGGSAIEYTVHNMATGAVAGSVYVQAARINGFLVVNWEEC